MFSCEINETRKGGTKCLEKLCEFVYEYCQSCYLHDFLRFRCRTCWPHYTGFPSSSQCVDHVSTVLDRTCTVPNVRVSANKCQRPKTLRITAHLSTYILTPSRPRRRYGTSCCIVEGTKDYYSYNDVARKGSMRSCRAQQAQRMRPRGWSHRAP